MSYNFISTLQPKTQPEWRNAMENVNATRSVRKHNPSPFLMNKLLLSTKCSVRQNARIFWHFFVLSQIKFGMRLSFVELHWLFQEHISYFTEWIYILFFSSSSVSSPYAFRSLCHFILWFYFLKLGSTMPTLIHTYFQWQQWFAISRLIWEQIVWVNEWRSRDNQNSMISIALKIFRFKIFIPNEYIYASQLLSESKFIALDAIKNEFFIVSYVDVLFYFRFDSSPNSKIRSIFLYWWKNKK